MQYIYCFANTSLVLRLMTYLSKQISIDLMSVTVVYLVDRWIVRIKLRTDPAPLLAGNFRSFLNENGYPFKLPTRNLDAFLALDKGAAVEDVVRLYHLVIVSHGALNLEDIKNFRETFVSELGYCPPSLV